MTIAQFNEPVTAQHVLDAALTLLNSQPGLGGLTVEAKAWQWDKAPKNGGNYVAVTVTRTAGGNQRLGGGIAPSAWYLTTTAVGSVTNVTTMTRRCTLVLEGAEVQVDGVTSTGITFSSESGLDEDDGDHSLWTLTRVWNLHF